MTKGPRYPGDRLAPWLAVALVAALAAWQHWEVVAGGGAHLWWIGGDSWKNVYAVVYHALHGESWWHSELMNYPFGEHIALADGQPLLANALRMLARAGIIDERGLTYLVLLLPIVSIPVLAAVNYALLRTWGLRRVPAAGWCVAIALLYPQLNRVTAHFALSYGWAFPAMLLLWQRARSAGWSLGACVPLGALCAALGLTHFYYLGVGGAMLLALTGVDALAHPRRTPWPRAALVVAVAVVTPVVISYLVIAASDVYPDRVSQPQGLFSYLSRPQALLTDTTQPYWLWFDRHVKSLNLPNLEGRAFLGTLVGAALVVGCVGALVRRARGARGWRPPPMPSRLYRGEVFTCVAVAGLATAVFSWGFPMAVKGAAFDVLRDSSGPLRQLRSLGRFGWATYYLWAPLGATLLTGYCQRIGAPAWRWLALSAAIGFTATEGLRAWRAQRFEGTPHVFYPQRERLAAAVTDSAYAAVVPVPYFSTGSENLNATSYFNTLYLSTYPALQGGLPHAGLFLSRTSFSQAMAGLELAGAPVNVPTTLVTDRGDARYLFAVTRFAYQDYPWTREWADPYREVGTLVFENDWLWLYAVAEPDLPRVGAAARRRHFAREWGLAEGSPLPRRDTVVGGSGGLHRYTFEKAPAGLPDVGLAGSWGLPVVGPPLELAAARLPPGVEPSDTLAADVLVALRAEGQAAAEFELRVEDAAGAVVALAVARPVDDYLAVYEGWVSLRLALAVPPGGVTYSLTARAARGAAGGAYVDEVVVRDARVRYLHTPGSGGLRVVDGRVWGPL